MIEPMLCQTGQPSDLNREGWVSEIKFDGTRGFLIKTKDSFMIQNRKGVDYTRRLPEITKEAKDVDHTFIIDGEICFFNANGISEFTPCQRRCSTQKLGKIFRLMRDYPVTFVAFDILEWNGENLRHKPYWERKEQLEALLPYPNAHIGYATHTENPKKLLESIIQRGGEGIILKRLDSCYQEGVRSHDWLKIKRFHQTTCQVVGYTEGNNRRSNFFGSLVLTQNGKYVGNCGGGFSDRELMKITAMLRKSPQMPKPFSIDEPYTAVKTTVQVVVRYFQRTENGVFRFPSFIKLADSNQQPLFLGWEIWQKNRKCLSVKAQLNSEKKA